MSSSTTIPVEPAAGSSAATVAKIQPAAVSTSSGKQVRDKQRRFSSVDPRAGSFLGTSKNNPVTSMNQVGRQNVDKQSSSRTAKRIRKSSCLTVAPQAQHVVSRMNVSNQDDDLNVSESNLTAPQYAVFQASALSRYPRYPTAINTLSKRVHIPARVHDCPVSDVTVDTAADVPCISAKFL
ncbi:unnamed protein product, partial [Pylaiella littoralis]